MEQPFDRLAPLVRHHIANELGWPALRPVQEATIGPILDGENLVVVAPTAGGKTEAAFFPILSELAETPAPGLRVVYLSPIRALLNNQVERLRRYFRWLGCTVGVWHGDTGASERKRLRRSPPTCLMTTPESLESMLCSTLTEPEQLFAGVQVVVIDELHAFGGSDRGWHMLAVLDRIARLASRDIQRVGLSATVGNLEELLEWVSRGSDRPQRIVAPPGSNAERPDVKIDWVGSVTNAAKVVSALHRGEKRLVFCDSRVQVERLAHELRQRDVRTFVTHSSLSVDERRQAEHAFAESRDCVIVATSALELGIDVGDLDRVIQLEAPSSVASFLQRMGRTGRRRGTRANCLFLATSDLHLVRAAAVVNLWAAGYVEPVEPPPFPLHLLVQQGLALLLQQPKTTRATWTQRIHRFGQLWSIGRVSTDQVIEDLFEGGWLVEDPPYVMMGEVAEKTFGRRHFLELLSVFETPPIYTVMHGRRALGTVHTPSFFTRRSDGQPLVLSLGGQPWKVNHVDHKRRVAHVEPGSRRGTSRWLGSGAPVSSVLAAAMRNVLIGERVPNDYVSARARSALVDIAEEHAHIGPDGWVLEEKGSETRLWTFGGTGANALLELATLATTGTRASSDPLAVRLPPVAEPWTPERVLALREAAETATVEADSEGQEGKFTRALGAEPLERLVEARRPPVPAAGAVRRVWVEPDEE